MMKSVKSTVDAYFAATISFNSSDIFSSDIWLEVKPVLFRCNKIFRILIEMLYTVFREINIPVKFRNQIIRCSK
jgi:hypothetical protein